MDQKISELAVASNVGATDIIPIVVGGTLNKSVSVGVLSQNLPNFGNKGITKNVVVSSATTAIPLTGTVILLQTSGTPYVLSDGADGQYMTLVAGGILSVSVTNGYITSSSMTSGSSISLMFSATLSKWVVVSQYNCVIS